MDLFTLSGLLPALLVTLIALFCANFFVRDLAGIQHHEFASIDGLRGFLALAVYLHHSIYWYSFATHHTWVFGASHLYMNFGHVSVNLFFMITGFLFTLKLIDGRTREIDWLKLYCSRFMRLTPLYLCLMAAVFAIVAYETHFTALEETDTILLELRNWLLFVILGVPDINSYLNTHLITAGVIWTLPYEWYFYFLLPLLGLAIGSKSKSTSGVWLILGVVCLTSFYSWHLNIGMFYSFAAGILTAIIVRTHRLTSKLRSNMGNLIAIICLIIGYTCFSNYMSFSCLFVLATAFLFIACGNNLFGLLSCRPARALSCVSYGVYLLQGVVLFVVMRYGIPSDFQSHMSVHQYWWIICCLTTPLLVAISAASWRHIESPAISAAPRFAQWLRNIRTASTHNSMNTENNIAISEIAKEP